MYFLALLLEEREAGSLGEVAEAMCAKLIRRHPHVFGEAEANTAGEVLKNWDRIKRDVEGRTSEDEPFADVPENLPALLYARKVQRRAVAAGLGGEEAGRKLEGAERDAAERVLGERLFELVAQARRLRVDPELALRAAANRFRERAAES